MLLFKMCKSLMKVKVRFKLMPTKLIRITKSMLKFKLLMFRAKKKKYAVGIRKVLFHLNQRYVMKTLKMLFGSKKQKSKLTNKLMLSL